MAKKNKSSEVQDTEAKEINLRDKVEVEYVVDTAFSKKGDKTKLHPIAAQKLVEREIVKIETSTEVE